MKTDDKKKYRNLKRFIKKLGIESASPDINDTILDLMEALEVGMYTGISGSTIGTALQAESLEKIFERVSVIQADPTKDST